MAKKKYTPEATVDLLYNQLMSDYKGDAQVEAERQRQKSAEKKASGNSTNSSTSVQNTLQSPSAVSRGASAVGNIYKAPKRKYTTGGTVHGNTKGRSFAKNQTTKPKTSGTRGIGSATQEAFERGLSSRSLKENVGQRSSLSNKKSYVKESDLSDFSRNRSHNQAKILDKMQAFAQTQRYENELKKQRAEYDRLREEHPTSEWLKEEGWGALTNFNSTLASTADWLLPDVITPKAVQNALDYYKKEDEKQQKIVEEVRGGDPLRTIGGNLGVNIIQNVPAMLLAPLTAEGTIATTAGTLLNPETLSQTGNAITRALYSVARETGNNPMFWETFLRTAGPTYDKEIENGADPVRATLSALTNGLLNAQIEIGGGIEKFDPTETFWKALRRSGEEEGLEEIQQYAVEGLTNKALGSNTAKWFSTKRGEDAVINPIDMAEQGAYGALAGGLMGGGRAGVATLSRSLADAEYNRAFPDSKAHTQDLVEQALMQAREGQKSSEAEILATNIQNMMEQGEEVPTVLVRQLHNEVLRAQAENERDFSERKNEGYQQAVSEGRANTVETQDTEEESRVFRSVADEKAQTYYDTAMDKMGENASERSARAISKLMVGVHTNQDIDTILIDKNARNAVEEMTGIDLPIKNTDAREILETRGLANMVANRDNMLQETHNVIRSNMRGREGAVFEKNYDNAVKTIGVANAPEIYESVFSRFKNAGMVRGSDFDSAYDRIVSPLTKDFGEELGGRISLVFNRDFAHQAFDAGRQAYIADEAKTSAREKAVSAERAGTVTYKHDTESRLSTRQKKFMTEFAKRAKLGIEFYDGTQEGEDDSANGYYENGVIHININSTNKLITVAKHELTHHIKVTAPEMYRKLEDFVIKKWYNNDPDAFDERVLEYQRKWNCSVEVAYEEIIANASEAFFTDKGTIDDAVKFSKKLGHTIHDGIRTLLDTFLDIQDTDRLGDRGYGEFLKELNILKDAQRMWLEALNESVERGKNNTAEATEADTEVRRSLKDIGMTLKDGNARWTDERIDRLIDEFGASNPDYSQAYAVLMNPRDFLKLTLADEKLDEWNEASSSDNPAYSNYFRKLNTEDLKNEKQTPFLTIYSKDGTMVQGHEGRHRMRALLEAGVKSVPVVIRDTDTKYTKKPMGSMTLSAQDFGYDPVNNNAKVTIKDLVPIKESNRAELVEKFGGEAEVRFSKKDDQDYLDAVNRGDMETAQRMVDEYAKKAGYDVKAYHGTSNFGFTKFSTRDNNGNRIETENGRVFGDGFYFTDNKDVAEKRYANVLSRSRLVDGEWVTEKTNRGVYNVYLNLGNNYVLDWNDTKGMSQRDFDRLLRDIWKDHNSLTIKNVRDGIDITSTVYVVEMTPENAEQYWDTAWSSSRIKSADPVTYDDNGNIIPLSQRFNSKNEDIRWSRKDDQAYLDAVNRGDMETAQRMVDEYARKAGYDSPKLYHGTTTFGWTRPMLQGDNYTRGGELGVWTATTPESVRYYSGEASSVREIGLGNTQEEIDDTRWWNEAFHQPDDGKVMADGIYQFYGNLDGFLDVQPDTTRGASAFGFYYNGKKYTSVEMAEYAKEKGYKGVHIDSILDGNYYTEEYIFFEPWSQLKSADPVTYDDNGNVIPLSERFNEKNEDIRYSKKDAILDRIVDERRQKANDGEQLSFFGSLNDTMPEAPKQKTPAEMFYDDVLSTIAEIKKKGGWTGQEITHLLDETIYGTYADFHFIERLNDKSDDTAMSDFNAFLSFFVNETDLRNYKWYFSQYRSDKYWKTAFRSGKTKFTKAIDKRIEEIMAGKAKGRNVGIEARNYTLNEAREIFNSLNTDKDLQELADKVFDCIDKNFRVVYRGDTNIKGFSHTKGGIRGTSAGRTIDLNMKLFNSEAYTDQEKAHTLLHESIHAVTVYAINVYHNAEQYGMDVYDLPYNVRLACDQLDKVYDAIKYDSSFKGEYGVTNVKEMVAELSNPAFRAKLKAKNLYQRIVDAIKKIFGIDTNNAYDAVNVSLEVLLNNADAVTFEKYAHYTTSNSGARYSKKDSDGRTLTDAQAEYFKDSKARDKDGNLLVMYHSSPNKFTVFDRTRLGENSGFEYGNTAYGFFVTDYKPFSNRFGKNEMKLYANITKPITHPFMAHNKYDDAECERIAREWLEVIDPDQFETYEIYKEDEPDLTLYEFYMNLWEGEDPFDYAEYDRESLEEAGYDAVEICEGHQNELGKVGEGNDVPVTTYAVFNSNQLKNVDNENPTEDKDIRYSLTTKDKYENDEKLTRKQFNSWYFAHKINTRRGNLAEQIASIKSRGFKGGSGGINVMPADINDFGNIDVATQKYGVRKGETVLLVPKTFVKSDKVVEGFKPRDYEIVKAESDFQSYYELYEKAYDKAHEDTRYSKKDSDGRTLTDAQAEYFKDSKARDENGNLLAVYHGTSKDFTIFDRGQIGRHGSYEGAGFNFTPSETRARGYRNVGNDDSQGGVLAGYVNITHPLSSTSTTFTARQLAEVIRQIDPTGDDIIANYARDTSDYGKPSFIARESLYTARQLLDYHDTDVDIYSDLSASGGNADSLINAFKDMGYDGVIHYSDDGKIKTLITFDSNQFKDIDNLNPTDNPDRRLSRKTENEALPKARTIPKKIKDRLIALGADKLGKGGLKAPVQISVRDLRTLWYDVYGNEEGERLNKVLEDVGNKLQSLAGKYTYVSLADALEGTIHYRVDENGKPTSVVLSCKVKNAEYDINFDFTTICAKRAPLQKVLERFIKTEGKNKGDSLYDELRLDEEGLYTLRSIMEQEGFDVSCIGCFVEQNRYAQQTQSKTVADDWNKAIDEYEKKHGVKITEGFDFQNLDIDSLPYKEIQQGFRQYSALMKGKPNTVENKNEALIEAIPYLRKRLGNSDYASIAGQRSMMAMGNGKTNFYNLLKRGQADSKQSTPFVPYNGEVALLPESKKGKPIFDYLFGIGGARAQSASDFQIEYVFDYMQLVGDLAGRGLPMHMYTKVIECAELLGKCGIKINLSAMCDVDDSVDSENAGLKKVNGRWVYNISDQSIDYNKAVKLQRQEGYSKNVGIIMVTLSKGHMLKALSDNDVRYIIGYHSSKMPAVVAKASNMAKATDYTKLNKTNRLNDKGRALFNEAMNRAKGNTDLERYKDALRIFDDLIQEDKTKRRGEPPRRGNEYQNYMSPYKGNTADFDVYKDIKKTNDPRRTADNYIQYCMDNDLVPMYFPFAFHENYYKCEVYDYNVYDNVDENGKPTGNGKYAPMEAVQNVYPDLNIAEGETDSKKFMARVNKMLKAQNEKNKALEPKYERVERRAIAELSITGNDYMDMDASGIDHAELEHRVDMTEEAVEERRRSIKEKELNAKTIEYQSTIRKLEKNVEGLKAQFKRTNKKPNPVEARRQAGRLIQRHASNMSIHEDVANTLTEIYEMYAKRGAKAFDDIYAIAERTAVEIVNNISEVHFEGQEEYKQIKDYLRDTDIVVSEEMKRNITDFNDFRKSHFGKLKLVNGERSNIDSVYAELNEMFPSQFTDEYVNPADQLNHIADVLDSYAPFYETLDGTSEEMQDYVVAVASDLMETAYNLQKSKTFADKKYDEKVKAVKKAREKALANKKEALSKLRARYSSRMAEAVRDAKSETKAKIDEKAQKKRRIAQIAKTHKRLADKLFTPSDTKHLPDGYDKAVANVLHMFDFTTSRMEKWAETHDEPSKRMQALRDLRKRLESYVRASEDGNKEGVDLGMEVDSDLIEIVDELEGALGENVKLSDLDSTVLEDVATLFRAFEHQINSYNRAFDENNQKRISDLADVVVDEAKAVKHGKWRAGIMGRVFTSNLNPWDFFQMIGGEVGDLYKATRKGFDKYENNLRVAKNFMADLIGSRQYDKWANHTKTYKTTSGEEITLTDTQLMSLYCLSKREQAQGHIYGQGVVSAPVKVKRNMIAKQLDKKRVIPTFDDVVDWTKNLSKEQIEVADKIQNFLSNEVAEWGNETSLKLYGYKKFTEKDYFPIQSSDDYLNSNFDAKGSDPTLKNISPTKAVVKGANNPLMLDDIFSIFSKHVAQMASYNGFVPAITDFQRVWNHKMVSADGRKTTVKETFGEAYGDRIAKYVEQFYADLNGVYKKNLDVTTPEKLFGTFKKSAVGGNLRVLAQQPMAIARAMLLIDPALLTVSVPKTALQAKRTYQEMLEHCPIAEWKVWGFYSPDVMGASRDLKNVMLGKDSISDKVFMNMYGVADNITWTVIFNACKMQVERQNKGIAKGSQEYWDKVNDLASDVYDATQVVDSPFHRSELMKSQDGIHKMATAFMAEPTKTINMINTQLTLCAREISEGKVGKATLRFTRLTGTVLANAMLLAVGQSLIDAMRSAGGGDDDDDKGDFEERFKKHWVTNTKDNLNLLKMLPYVKDAVSIYEGFGVTRMDMNGVEKAVKATQNLKKYYDDPGSAKYTELELWNNTAMAFAYTLGVPISNAKRDLDSLALTVAESVKDPKVMLWYMKNKYQVNSKTKSIWADAYYDALDKGNTGLAKNIYAYMKKSGVDDKYIQNRKTTWEKHRYGEDSNGTDSED